MNEDLNFQYIVLPGTKKDSEVLLDAIKYHIDKLAEDVSKYSKCKHDQSRLQNAVDGIKSLMNMRDSLELIGSDHILSMYDLPSPLKHII